MTERDRSRRGRVRPQAGQVRGRARGGQVRGRARGKEARRAAEAPATEKLHKVLADLGHGSRREMERWIEAGRVEVNGEPATLGDRVASDDRIRVDGKLVRRVGSVARVLLMNKAEGVVCSRRDPDGRPTCFDELPKLSEGRWVGVGRLDISTTGLLLITTDGALANRLMHPSTGIDREYAARIDRPLTDEQLARLTRGVRLDGETARFSDIRHYEGRWYHLTLMEGRNREVRRLFEAVGVKVARLKRVRYGPVVLPSTLKRGRWLELEPGDVAALYRLLRMDVPRLPARAARDRQRGAKGRSSVLIPYPELPAPPGGENSRASSAAGDGRPRPSGPMK